MAAQGAPRPLTRRRQDSHLQPPTPSAVLALSEWLILCPHHSPTRCTGSPPSSMNAGHSMLLLILFSPLAHPLVQAAPHTATRQLLTTVDTSPSPLSSPSLDDGPVQVFVLAGQSNMVGYGLVEATDSHGGDFTLEALVTSGSPAYQHLRDSAGEWTVRDDVDVEVYGAVNKISPLTVGLGADDRFFGPELQSGHVLGERLSQKVLLIKVAWGGRSLHGKTQPQT